MTISWLQAAILGLFACLCSNSCMAGQAVGNYTIGRPLVGGLVCGIILGNVPLGIACGVATQLVYIALVTPGGTVAADVRAISYIGIPLAMVAISSRGLNPFSSDAANMAKSLGTLVGTVGSVLFYAVAFMNLIWQAFGWKDIENNKLNRLYGVDFGWPWLSHLCFSFLPTMLMTHFGAQAVTALRNALPMDGIPMKTLFTVGAMLPCVGIAILLRQIVNTSVDFIPFLVGFTLAASLHLNLVSITIISLLFAMIFYEIEMFGAKSDNGSSASTVSASSSDDDDEEEEDI
ncbi:PTS mannose/fructose/sorbose/N-acetylgalactosamine transporter subunit IIC [Lactobacillus kefiranofaciens]|uniref:PTS sugar transporter subunit IIC n=1 Tax=Lactobacillus kefiranofaciens TaxID=267818 RepID=A0AAX3UGP1_9LACO|nr:PTS sugar transporter subunit IIC [Lactobacillus kefiranofaciens]AEG39804.1 Phosphoenolpyruvate-dependent sugar phosphotransferase system EIIC, mannose specific [Lactobacillus kefiranofaciens subsp. kefiranofaciens]MCJ2171531.1 PTS sugar transporter subunit IIC [Lactobacillus kefiranofaciens]MCP9330479.1 PTS sugar transporter subunit IIC [Lactobacillus kefiranofaciens]MDH5100239.1 PTS sugar transporter subunit IIC [Lactobacillus kefiranofaciens]PAK99175.1 PTS sorbose transporter subunit IIC